MKRTFSIAISLLGFPWYTFAEAGPSGCPTIVAQPAELGSRDGALVGRGRNVSTEPDSFHIPGALGTVGYSIVIDPKLQPSQILRELVRDQNREPIQSATALSLDIDRRAVVVNRPAPGICPLDEMRYALFASRAESFVATWGFELTAEHGQIDVLVAFTDEAPVSRMLLFSAHHDRPEELRVGWLPLSISEIEAERLNASDQYGLFERAGRYLLILPLKYGDQAWELRLPQNGEDLFRFDLFPLSDFEVITEQ